MADCLTLKKSNCKNCYKCIRHCPVKSIRFSGNQAYIIGNECILCGQCFVVCPQNAKEIVDETEKVRVLLQSGAPVIASLAPSFAANYEGVGIESMRKALKALGFTDAEETALGATIVKREYERILKEEKRDVLISSCCHSINLLIQKYYPAARRIMNIRAASDVLGEPVVRIMDPTVFMQARTTGRDIRDHRAYLPEYQKYVEQTVVYDREYHLLICILRDVTDEETQREKKESISRQTVEIADKVVDKQMRIVQEIASLLGETAAETKIALTKLKESISDE